jgi:hypothetical protein
MRLTTRLMQLASWLLIRRAVCEGELTPEQALEEHETIVTTAIGLLATAIGFLNDSADEMEAMGVRVDDMLADTLEYDGKTIMEF